MKNDDNDNVRRMRNVSNPKGCLAAAMSDLDEIRPKAVVIIMLRDGVSPSTYFSDVPVHLLKMAIGELVIRSCEAAMLAIENLDEETETEPDPEGA